MPLALLLAAPAVAAAAPTISGADTDVWNAGDPAPTYTIASTAGREVQWRLDDGAWSPGRPSPLDVTLEPIADGQHVLAAREASVLPLPVPIPGPAVRRSFRVDTTPPSIDVRVPEAGATYTQGAAVVARYSCSAATTCAGPVPSGQPLPTAQAGPAAFRVRATDDAGNAATARADYSVAPPTSGAPGAPIIRLAPSPAPKVVRGVPVTTRARLLSPPAGSRVTTRGPRLSWRPRAGARLYNLQIFGLEGDTPRKVLSAFPTTARFRVPDGVLAFGNRYLWRVWPYLAGGYPRQPIGLSWFDVERPVRLSAAQLLITQRIAQAAVRRIDAVERWLNQGVTSGDLRDGGLGPEEFSAAVTLAGAGAPISNGLATPRPLEEPSRARTPRRSKVAVTRRQLLINQRISQAAVRRASALERRLDAGLTGGDLRDGAITASKLAPGLSVASAPATGPSMAPTRSAVPKGAGRSGGRVSLTDRQALINQRISQAAVRRANGLRALVQAGLTGEQFRQGSIGSAKLSAEVRR